MEGLSVPPLDEVQRPGAGAEQKPSALSLASVVNLLEENLADKERRAEEYGADRANVRSHIERVRRDIASLPPDVYQGPPKLEEDAVPQLIEMLNKSLDERGEISYRYVKVGDELNLHGKRLRVVAVLPSLGAMLKKEGAAALQMAIGAVEYDYPLTDRQLLPFLYLGEEIGETV